MTGLGQEVDGPGAEGDDGGLEEQEGAGVAPEEVEEGDGEEDRLDVGAQAVGQAFDVGHGEKAAVAGVPDGLVDVPEVEGGGEEGVVTENGEGAKVGDVGQDEDPHGQVPGKPDGKAPGIASLRSQ